MTELEIRKKLDVLYPIFEQNVRTWTTSKWYRQVPLKYLEELREFLNEECGSNKFTCNACNIGGMLDRLNTINLNYPVKKKKVKEKVEAKINKENTIINKEEK